MEIPTRNSKSNFSFMIFCLLLLDLCHPIALVDTAVLLSTYYYLLRCRLPPIRLPMDR
jgi:hypothetical protein